MSTSSCNLVFFVDTKFKVIVEGSNDNSYKIELFSGLTSTLYTDALAVPFGVF